MAGWRLGSRVGGIKVKKDRARHWQTGRADCNGRLQHGPDVRNWHGVGNIFKADAIERTKTVATDDTDSVHHIQAVTIPADTGETEE